MNDLITWLRAQLDEDERVACAVKPLDHTYDMGGTRMEESHSVTRWIPHSEDGRHSSERDPAAAALFARHDPARVLAEVEAKRRVLDLATLAAQHEVQDVDGPISRLEKALARVTAPELEKVVRLLAVPYADRPGYLEEWHPRPERRRRP